MPFDAARPAAWSFIRNMPDVRMRAGRSLWTFRLQSDQQSNTSLRALRVGGAPVCSAPPQGPVSGRQTFHHGETNFRTRYIRGGDCSAKVRWRSPPSRLRFPRAADLCLPTPPQLPVVMPPPNTEQARWFAEEVLPHEPALRGYLRSQFPAIDDDDVVQESYLKLLKAEKTGRILSIKSYLFSIARNTARTLFRRRRIYSDTPVNELRGPAVLHEGCTPSDTTDSRQRLELVITAIDALPSRCREIIELTLLDGLSSAEVAVRLGLAESTVRVQLARGIRKCGDYLRAEGERS